MKVEKLHAMAEKYPHLPQETIETLLTWWKPRSKVFHAPYNDGRVKADTIMLPASSVYNRLAHYGEKPPDEATAIQWKKHNHDLLAILKSEFGWREDDERFFPNPDHVFDY